MEFITGIIAGLIMAFLGLAVLHRLLSKQIAAAEIVTTTNAEKLVMARKRFGQIANRQSINEARIIANKALKEIQS